MSAEDNVTVASRRRLDALKPEYRVAAVYVASMFISIMDSTVINVALPTLGRDFHAAISSVQWVIIGYLLSLAVFIPASGWFGDRFGTKRVLLAAIVLFTASSALCASSVNLGELVGFRVLQGVGGGMMTPVGMAMLLRAFPPERRVRASKVLMIPTVLAPASGPVIGGVLITSLSWRWIFLVNIPIGVAAATFGAFFLAEHREPRSGGFDRLGFLLSGAGLALFLYSVSEGPTNGWTNAAILLPLVAGVALSVLFVRHEWASRHPILELHLLADRMFRRANVCGIFGTAAFMGALFLAPLYLQEGRGYSALRSGLTTFPEALGVIVFSQVAARLYPIVGPRRLMAAGLFLVAAVVVTFSFAGGGTNPWLIRLIMFGIGVGMSNQILSLQACAYATIKPAQTGHASAIFNTQRQVSTACAVALLGTVLAAIGGHGVIVKPSAFHVVFLVDAALAACGALASLRIRDEDALNTMIKKQKDESVSLDREAMASA